MKFFIVSVATTFELSPSVYAGRKFATVDIDVHRRGEQEILATGES